MKKILNKRLETLSAFINEGESVIDIGCDHSLLGIYLLLNRNNVKVVSSDINKKPLDMAYKNLLKYHQEDKIELRMGNGLETLTSDISTIVISGMGGINIVNILESINNYPYINKIIVSPNSDFELTRKEISKLGFKLNREKIVVDNEKFYLISEYIKGQETIDCFFGKLDKNDKDVRAYFKKRMLKNNDIMKYVLNIKKEELQKENNKIEKWLKV